MGIGRELENLNDSIPQSVNLYVGNLTGDRRIKPFPKNLVHVCRIWKRVISGHPSQPETCPR